MPEGSTAHHHLTHTDSQRTKDAGSSADRPRSSYLHNTLQRIAFLATQQTLRCPDIRNPRILARRATDAAETLGVVL